MLYDQTQIPQDIGTSNSETEKMKNEIEVEGLPAPMVTNGNETKHQHRMQCKVCLHKDLAEIEQVYHTWMPITHIAKKYGLSYDSLERHVRTFGLQDRRNRNMAGLIDRLIDMGLQGLAPEDIGSQTIAKLIDTKSKLLGLLSDIPPINIGINIESERKSKQTIGLARFGVVIAQQPAIPDNGSEK